MNYILACVDGSRYTDAVVDCAHWSGIRMNESIYLLHVQRFLSEEAINTDLSGSIGIDANSELLEKLVQVDEQRGRLDREKGTLILSYSEGRLKNYQYPNAIKTVHRRGSLVDTISDMKDEISMVILGKRGIHESFATQHLGSNLERVARSISRPIFAVARSFKPVHRVLIAFDGGACVEKILNFLSSSLLFKDTEVEVLHVGIETEEIQTKLLRAVDALSAAGIKATSTIKPGNPTSVINAAIIKQSIDLLIMGSYGHSRFRTLMLGSTTTELVRSCDISVLLFH